MLRIVHLIVARSTPPDLVVGSDETGFEVLGSDQKIVYEPWQTRLDQQQIRKAVTHPGSRRWQPEIRKPPPAPRTGERKISKAHQILRADCEIGTMMSEKLVWRVGASACPGRLELEYISENSLFDFPGMASKQTSFRNEQEFWMTQPSSMLLNFPRLLLESAKQNGGNKDAGRKTTTFRSNRPNECLRAPLRMLPLPLLTWVL